MVNRLAPFIVLVAISSTAAAATPYGSDLAQLGSSGYRERHVATRSLLADTTLTQETIASLYAAATGPEQRHRLLTIARHHLLRRLREQTFVEDANGSIGIRLEGLTAMDLPHVGHGAIVVVDTLPGFPAHEQLLPGDLILAVDGQTLSSTDRSRQRVRQAFVDNGIRPKRANQTVRLTIMRVDRTQDVMLRLASHRALNQMYPQRRAGTEPQLSTSLQRQWNELRDGLTSLGPPRKTLARQDNRKAEKRESGK